MSSHVIPPAMLVPFSGRETFSEAVCGLPSRTNGCVRCVAAKRFDSNLEQNAIAERRRPRNKVWIVFRRSEGDELLSVNWYADDLADIAASDEGDEDYNCDVARFAFEIADWTMWKDQGGQFPVPVFAEYFATRKRPIVSWLTSKDGPGLSERFGPEVFVARSVTNLGIELRLADLITAYIDKHCGRYRGHDLGKQLGTFQCHLEIREAQIKSGKAKEDDPLVRVLEDYWISFALLDPATNELRHVEELKIGRWTHDDSDVHKSLLTKPPEIPLRLVSSRAVQERPQRSYIDFFTDAHRGELLPDELSSGRLVFSIGEVATYILHWTIVRLLATNGARPAERAFADRFNEWWRTKKDFNRLVYSVSVSLDLAPRLFSRQHLDAANYGRLLATNPKHQMSFGELLSEFWIPNNKWGRTVVEEMVKFLKLEFSEKRAPGTRGIRNLPMYRELDWKWDDASPDRKGMLSNLEQVIRSISRRVADQGIQFCEAEADQIVQRCVFPLGTTLTFWPQGALAYYILPIWEQKVGERAIPVIFAHAFAQTSLNPQIGRPAEEAALEPLLALVHAFGRMISDSYHEQATRQQEGLNTASGWAHEVKNYTEPVLLDFARLTTLLRRTGAGSAILEPLGRVQFATTLLNKISVGIQQAIGLRDPTGKKEGQVEPLILPSDRAKGIVEVVIQYLLHFQRKTVEADFDLDWEGRWELDVLTEKCKALFLWANRGLRDADLETARLKFDAGDGLVEFLDVESLLWVFGLLREPIWNISPWLAKEAVPKDLRAVRASYKLEPVASELIAHIDYTCLSANDAPKGSVEEPKGVKLANSIFGPRGANIGEIVTKEIGSEKDGDLFRWILGSTIAFRVDGRRP